MLDLDPTLEVLMEEIPVTIHAYMVDIISPLTYIIVKPVMRSDFILSRT